MILPFYFTYAMRLQQQRRLRDGRRREGTLACSLALSLSLSDPIGFVVSVSISATTVTPIATVELIQSPAQNEPAYLATVAIRGTAGELGGFLVPLFRIH